MPGSLKIGDKTLADEGGAGGVGGLSLEETD